MTYSRVWFSQFNKLLYGSILEDSTHTDIIWFSNLFLQLKNRKSRSKAVCNFPIIFKFERNYDFAKPNNQCSLLNKNINFNKRETKWKVQNLTLFLERWKLCFSSYRICELKVKLWSVGACERKKMAFFVTFILFEGYFFWHLRFISMWNVLNKLSECIHL